MKGTFLLLIPLLLGGVSSQDLFAKTINFTDVDSWTSAPVDISLHLLKAVTRNMSITLTMRATAPLHFRMFHCDHVILQTNEPTKFEQIYLQDAWIPFMVEEKCETNDTQFSIDFSPQSLANVNFTFYNAGIIEDADHVDKDNIVNKFALNLEAHSTKSFNTYMIPALKKAMEVNTTTQIALVSDFNAMVKLEIRKCNIFGIGTLKIAKANLTFDYMMLEEFLLISQLKCVDEHKESYATVDVTTQEDTKGTFSFEIIDITEKSEFFTVLVNVGILTVTLVPLVIAAIIISNRIWKCTLRCKSYNLREKLEDDTITLPEIMYFQYIDSDGVAQCPIHSGEHLPENEPEYQAENASKV